MDRLVRRIAAISLFHFAAVSIALCEENGPIVVHPFAILPFVLLLLAIALAPFINRHWWEKRYPLVAAALAAIILLYYVFALQAPGRMVHSIQEYASFIILIGSLFIVAGGIHIRVKGSATPISNIVFLLTGAVLSNFLGTTGASMILVRPYLHANRMRIRPYHLVFFIFIVSNMGGALTPIGDPPLFLGYLRGVPFFWVLEHLWDVWLVGIGIVLLVFFAIDTRNIKNSASHRRGIEDVQETWIVEGLQNILFLAVILGAVFLENPPFLREGLMVLAAAASYFLTKKEVHRKNDFNFLPVREVAILFAAIFITMVPALDWLELNAARIGISTPGQFYWGTGMLSSVLDNAPTYLNFLSASIGLFVDQDIVMQVQHLVSTHGSDMMTYVHGPHAPEIQATFSTLVKYHSELVSSGAVPLSDIQISYLIGNQNLYLRAISLSAVFFGAMTYIGNGPNFMVKSIAEQANVKCPSFVGYVTRYSLPILLPTFLLIWWLFFRG